MTPETILRWCRELIANKYGGTARRVLGALRNVGHELSRNTIKRILREHGLEPAPPRGKRMPWKTFLKAHLGLIAATDFFTVEVLTFTGLVRYFVLFVIDIETRCVQIAGIVRHPHGRWMTSAKPHRRGRRLLKGKRYLIHDRDPLFTKGFSDLLEATGVKCLKLPAHRPNLNAYAERFVLSIKSECLSKLVPLGERHLRVAVAEFVEHYHRERNHQGLDNQLLTPAAPPVNDNARIARRERLGGLLSFYYRRAA